MAERGAIRKQGESYNDLPQEMLTNRLWKRVGEQVRYAAATTQRVPVSRISERRGRILSRVATACVVVSRLRSRQSGCRADADFVKPEGSMNS